MEWGQFINSRKLIVSRMISFLTRLSPRHLIFTVYTISFCVFFCKESTAQVKFKHIDHVGIHIKSLDSSYSWYEKVFGFEIINKWKTTWMIGKGHIRIGLFQRPDGHSLNDSDINNLIFIEHFAIVVTKKNFELMQKHLKQLDIPFDPPEDTGIAFSIFIRDPDNYNVEITYYY